MAIRVVVTDLDGTLLGPGMSNYYHFVPDWCTVIEAFQRDGGCWVMNTGRTHKKMIEILQLQPRRVWPDHLLIQESEIFHLHGGNHYEPDRKFNDESVRLRRELMQRVLKRLPKWYEVLRKRYRIEAIRNHGTEITIVAKTVDDADGIMAAVNDWKVEVAYLSCNRNQRVVALMHASYNKGVIMRRLMQANKWHRSEVLSIGDSINDVTILDGRTSQHVAAPSNAEKPIRKIIRNNNGYVGNNPFGWGSLESVIHFLQTHGQLLGGMIDGFQIEAPTEAFGPEGPPAKKAGITVTPGVRPTGAGAAAAKPAASLSAAAVDFNAGLAATEGGGTAPAMSEGDDPNDALVAQAGADHDPNDAIAADAGAGAGSPRESDDDPNDALTAR